MSIVLAILGAAAATTTGVLLERYLRTRDDQRDGPPIPPLPDLDGELPAPAQEQPPAATEGTAPLAGTPGPRELVGWGARTAAFPPSPVHGELHVDERGRYWAFSNVDKQSKPWTRGWSEVRRA